MDYQWKHEVDRDAGTQRMIATAKDSGGASAVGVCQIIIRASAADGSLQAARRAVSYDRPARPLTEVGRLVSDPDGDAACQCGFDFGAGCYTLRPEDGLVLRANGRTGIVLPWEGKDPHTRLRWAYMKAGVRQGTSAQIEILKAQRYRYPEEKKR